MSDFGVEYSEANLSQIAKIYSEQGFVLIESVFAESEIDEMKLEMSKIIEELNLDQHPKSVFTTEDDDRHASDRYFLDSAANISHFFEEGALDKDGKLVVPKSRALNKVGHALHWLDPIFKVYTFDSRVKKIIEALDFRHPKVVQSMYIFKQPKIGGAVTDHIDATFLRSTPTGNVVGIWIALDEATKENGCLWFVPGSHKTANLDYKFIRTEDPGPDDPLMKFVGERPTYDQTKFVPVVVKKGSLLLIHSQVVHKSEPNTSSQSRHAYTFHVADGESKNNWTWDKSNWLQETDEYKFPNLFDS